MTKAQTKQYKQANQRRKAALINYHKSIPANRYHPSFGGLPQDGKYTKV